MGTQSYLFFMKCSSFGHFTEKLAKAVDFREVYFS